MHELSDILQLIPTVICWVIVGAAITGLLIVVFKKKEVEKSPITEEHKKQFGI